LFSRFQRSRILPTNLEKSQKTSRKGAEIRSNSSFLCAFVASLCLSPLEEVVCIEGEYRPNGREGEEGFRKCGDNLLFYMADLA